MNGSCAFSNMFVYNLFALVLTIFNDKKKNYISFFFFFFFFHLSFVWQLAWMCAMLVSKFWQLPLYTDTHTPTPTHDRLSVSFSRSILTNNNHFNRIVSIETFSFFFVCWICELYISNWKTIKFAVVWLSSGADAITCCEIFYFYFGISQSFIGFATATETVKHTTYDVRQNQNEFSSKYKFYSWMKV